MPAFNLSGHDSLMETVSAIEQLRERRTAWRGEGAQVAFVPTMGNLHAGHLRLVETARAQAERVVVSVFVNPLQFGEGEDFDTYPRTLEQDAVHLRKLGVDLLFCPGEDVMYPQGRAATTRVEVPVLSDILCGASRPGFFVGVATVVCKLFNLVQPDLACFGEKDFQQLLVIRRMVQDLNLPVAVHGVPTVREADGLALSSRNSYLDTAQREAAPELYRTLCATRDRLLAGERDVAAVEAAARDRLAAAGFRPDYFSLRRSADLQAPPAGVPVSVGHGRDWVLLAAAWLGRARLIDNLRLG